MLSISAIGFALVVLHDSPVQPSINWPLVIPMLVAYVALLALAAVLSALEMSLFALRERGVAALPTTMPKEKEHLREILRDPTALLPEALLLGCLANLVLATICLWFAVEPLQQLGWNPWISAPILLGASLLAAELLPNALAIRSPEKVLLRTLPWFRGIRWILVPLCAPLRIWTEAAVRFFTPKKMKPRQNLDAEEIVTLIDMRHEQDAITGDEATLLKSMVGLHQLAAKDAMTPRVDLPLMPHDAEDDEASNMLETTRHQFVAVFDAKRDAIAYVVPVQQWKLSGRPHWSTLTQVPEFVPESLPLLEAMREHLKDDATAVVVVDEYGGFEGLLTRANVVEQILAKVAPAPTSSAGLQSIGPDRYLVSGTTRLDELERELELEFNAEGVDTIGGLVLNAFGYPPKPGEHITVAGVHIKVKRTARARIQQLELHVLETTGEEEAESP
ncbi:CBS domain containing-hemolysin-like protein [Roseimicrobium gellanilyticum]|uniref:CBS domain containing-hemolysin-like protein n=1 Tax=Roseimicrobium gellanilyticum TaxID=748857 RepID=A0A366HP05_9BACT|nr:CNNM domain-containing protein [Roseimicrobium gellanilyticum]RBP45250.1 CBS domain containing-hemolysin-like protein [Roseimicrobium gellanilyticum]